MRSFRSLLGYMKPYLIPALLAPLLMALEVAMDLLQPRFLQSIIDVGVARGDLVFVLRTGLSMVGIALVGLVGGIGCTVCAIEAGLGFGASVREALFRKVQELSFGNLDRLQTGGLITRLTNDVDQVQEAAMILLRAMVRAPLLTVGSIIMAALTAPRLSLILLLIGPLLILLLLLVNRRAHPRFIVVQDRLDRVNSLVQENLAGVRVIKAFVRSGYESDRFAAGNEQLSSDTVRASVLVAALMPGMMLLLHAGIVAALWFGGKSVMAGGLRLGQLLAFTNYLMQMLTSLMMAGMFLIRVSRADASAERIAEVLQSRAEVPETPAGAPAPVLRGSLAFEEVSFSYGGTGGTPVLQDISFTAEPGQTVAVLGSTGSGKSTLVHLIPRLYDVTAGRVLLDGSDVRSLARECLQRQIAVVLQDTILFTGTVRENLLFGRSDASPQELETAARMARAHDFVSGFPDGYETVLGQRGVNLSGGQKQRLAIARALVARPAVLILDDCTSSVDMATEAAVMAALRTWEHPCTRIVVAQRIATVMDADLILVLEDGYLSASGRHEDLLRTSRVYGEIVASQLRGGEVRHVD